MTDYAYDPDLPYVVPYGVGETARFSERTVAVRFSHEYTSHTVIDTTPKPRVPEDAKFITWTTGGYRSYAEASDLPGRWFDDEGGVNLRLEDLPNVTPDTAFTVLDERKS
jgi:hypothetical protein